MISFVIKVYPFNSNLLNYENQTTGSANGTNYGLGESVATTSDSNDGNDLEDGLGTSIPNELVDNTPTLVSFPESGSIGVSKSFEILRIIMMEVIHRSFL